MTQNEGFIGQKIFKSYFRLISWNWQKRNSNFVFKYSAKRQKLNLKKVDTCSRGFPKKLKILYFWCKMREKVKAHKLNWRQNGS